MTIPSYTVWFKDGRGHARTIYQHEAQFLRELLDEDLLFRNKEEDLAVSLLCSFLCFPPV
jgi:hypothetical protein